MRLKRDENNIILEAFINNTNSFISSHYVKNSKSWKDIKVGNTCILYNEAELHIYTFNMKSRKIKLQCYNIKFLKYAMKLYNKINPDTLEVEEIKEIAQPIDNDELKKQWILYAISQKYFLVFYGEKLLKSAIIQNNIELIESIYNKVFEYFKKDPKNNIYILSLLCKNMPYLNQNYSEFLSKYYNEMNLFIDTSNSSIIYNDLHHLYSSCNELKITKNTFIYYFLQILYTIFFYPLHIIQNFFLKLSKLLKLLFKTTSAIYLNLIILILTIVYGAIIIQSNRIVGFVITIIVIILFSLNWKSHPLLILISIAGIAGIVYNFYGDVTLSDFMILSVIKYFGTQQYFSYIVSICILLILFELSLIDIYLFYQDL
jgi:hypothetical protein